MEKQEPIADGTSSQVQGSESPLPAPATPLIGRSSEVSLGCQLMEREGVRLVTLTGPGGIGKSRLAVRIASDLRHRFSDGVHWVSLESLHDAELVIPTIAQSFGLKDQGDRPILDRLKEHLHNQALLLLLDNFEQVVAAASQIAELLSLCPSLKILITSRTLLRIRGEYEVPIPPLSLPSLPETAPSDPDPQAPSSFRTTELSRYAAVAMFVERASAVKPDFRLTDENLIAVAMICQRLDGLPLAIELAAARIKLLPPQAMLARLAQAMDWLTSGSRDMPRRQRTLRYTFQCSYDLLDPDEQLLFRRLGVFVGGCTLEAVLSIMPGNQVPLLDLLASLIDNNLLRQVEQADGEPRLYMLETLREYALEQLTHHSELEAVQQRHGDTFVTLVEQAERHLTGADQTTWLDRLDREQGNIRAVLQNALKRGDAETAVRLSGAFWRFWYLHGQLGEGRRWLESALAISDGISLPLRIKVFSGAGFLAANLGDYAQARQWGQEALMLAQTWGNKESIAAALLSLATTGVWQGDELSIALYAQALTLYQELEDPAGIALATGYLAFAHWFRGDYEEAHRLFDEALRQLRALNNQSGIAFALYGLGFAALNQRDDDTAARRFTEALEIMQALRDKRGLIRPYYGLGRVALNQGNYAVARINFEQSCALAREVGDQWSLAAGLEALAGLAAATGKPALAAHLFGAADEQWSRIGAQLSPAVRFWYERDARMVHKVLAEADFRVLYDEGRRWTPDEALAQVTAQFAATRAALPFGLTVREQEVLHLVAAGLTDPQIAKELVISVRTAQSHVSAILGKLGVSSRTAAARIAVENGLA